MQMLLANAELHGLKAPQPYQKPAYQRTAGARPQLMTRVQDALHVDPLKLLLTSCQRWLPEGLLGQSTASQNRQVAWSVAGCTSLLLNALLATQCNITSLPIRVHSHSSPRL